MEQKNKGVIMNMEEIVKSYPFLEGALVDELENAKLAGDDTDLFKIVAHFIMDNNSAVVKQFIDAGMDVNAVEINDFGSTLLHNTIRYGDMESFLYLIDKGADINFQDKVGWTPLMESVMDDKAAFGKILMERGVDVNVSNARGATAKMLVQKFGRTSFSSFL